MQEFKISKVVSTQLEVGEICEWAHISADQPTLENDSDIDNKQIFQLKCDQFVIASQKLNDRFHRKENKLIKLNGNLVNNLKGKASIIALQNNQNKNEKQREEKQDYSDDEYNQAQIGKGEESPDKKVFRLSENYIHKNEKEFENGKRNRIVEVQLKKIEIQQISFIETWDQLKRSQDIKEQIQFLEHTSSLFVKLIGCFSVHLKNKRLINEKNQVCIMAETSFNDNNDYHFRMLYTIYCQLMTTDYCLRYGYHWEMIGFQGTDPATDLRNTGILGLVQMLAFISDYKLYVKSALNTLSKMNIPFCITLINITSFVLVSLRDNKLNYLINQEDSVISVINKLYFAGFHLLIKALKKEKIQFNKIGVLLTNVRKQIHEYPQKLIQQFQHDIQLFYKLNDK
ncbi:unnamed protein product [Paramecium primaurelia]|uniref:ELMO domain-containing protein n=1 Tax=Paramecium primaurelia TaxID=5886 RepID=A0A8S1N9Q8_PARPR|nr:unnamed protein product [Paramecium primaurelia]